MFSFPRIYAFFFSHRAHVGPVDLPVEELHQPPVGVEAGAEAEEAAQAHEPGELGRGEDIYREVQQDWYIPKTYEIPLNHLLVPFQL